VAAIHHAGPRLDGNASLLTQVKGLLHDADSLVRRYAAVTLARAGFEQGVRELLAEMSRCPAELSSLESCLRDCRQFPFVSLLASVLEMSCLGGLPAGTVRDTLTRVCTLTEEAYERLVLEQPREARRIVEFLGSLGSAPGLRPRAG